MSAEPHSLNVFSSKLCNSSDVFKYAELMTPYHSFLWCLLLKNFKDDLVIFNEIVNTLSIILRNSLKSLKMNTAVINTHLSFLPRITFPLLFWKQHTHTPLLLRNVTPVSLWTPKEVSFQYMLSFSYSDCPRARGVPMSKVGPTPAPYPAGQSGSIFV